MARLEAGGRVVPCRGVLFDKDGTLLHFMALWGGWTDYVLNDLEQLLEMMGAKLTCPRERLLGTMHDASGRVCDYDVQGPLAMATVEESIGLLAWQLYVAGMPWNEATTQVRQITKNAMHEVRRQKPAFPMPGLQHFLEACRKASLPMGVVTSDNTDGTLEQLEWIGLKPYFPVVLGRDRVSSGKPHPEMAEMACSMLGIDPAEAVVIGDSNADMQMAKQAGAALAIGLYQGQGEPVHLVDADVVISDYNELKVLV
ncbi:HAD family hydrolase [Paenibacillus campinasensis]|uniref:Haloacid dehalogenase n=1 Tax=Paenibacillus campinasensis TaxID=66347 RepID=A0A268F4Y1_9BACL|nr:HAD family hydrolase [Paenibacillus campinasensis]PAD80443.1 haloacid dehalogenase [Paenibacillus campinasensis]